MTRRLAVVAVLVGVVFGTTATFAHEEFRIIGTVQKVTATRLDIKQTKDGQIISMTIDAETIVTRDKKKVNRAELKTGLNVVVDAFGDRLDDLQVLEVRLVPKPSGN
jgi:hypothetical protein